MNEFEWIGPAQGHGQLRTALERARALGDDRVLNDATGLAMAFLHAHRDLDLVEGLQRDFRVRPHGALRAFVRSWR